MFKKLELENFTVFEKASFEWVDGINVFVGENGTGKTHLLKLLYCAQIHGNNTNLSVKMDKVFNPSHAGRIHYLVRSGKFNNKYATWIWQYGDAVFDAILHDSSGEIFTSVDREVKWDNVPYPVYIPAKEVLSFAAGFLQLYRRFNLAFDETYHDVLDLAYTPHENVINPAFRDILSRLQIILGGEVIVDGDSFLLGNLAMHLVAEGHRKLALLWQLLRNGSIVSGTTLFWDEPEANLNPALMQEVVKVLLLLANSGVQIFVATHNDAFLRELDLQKESLPVRFFALEKTDYGVVPHPATSYLGINPNKIEEEYMRLYDLEVKRSLGML